MDAEEEESWDAHGGRPGPRTRTFTLYPAPRYAIHVEQTEPNMGRSPDHVDYAVILTLDGDQELVFDNSHGPHVHERHRVVGQVKGPGQRLVYASWRDAVPAAVRECFAHADEGVGR